MSSNKENPLDGEMLQELNSSGTSANIGKNIVSVTSHKEVSDDIMTRATMKSPPGDVSFIKTLFNIIILSLGTSNLTMPYWVQHTSMVYGIGLIILGAIINLWSFNLLKNLYLKHRVTSYEDLVLKISGKKMSIFLAICVIVFTLGLVMVYHVVIYKLIGGIINLVGKYGYASLNDFLLNSFWKDLKWKALINFSFTIFLFIPLGCMKSNSILSYSSMFGVISLYALMVIIIFQSPWYFKDYLKNIYKKNDKSTHLNVGDVSKGFGSDMLFIQGATNYIFNYTVQNGLIPVLSKYKGKKPEKFSKLINLSVIILLVTEIILTLAGYITEPINTPQLIIERRQLWKGDYIMMIGWIGLIITSIFKIPINFYNIRISCFAIFEKDVNQVSNNTNIAFTVIVLLLTTLIATFYQNVIDYFSLIASFCFFFFAMLIPALLYAKGMGLPKYHWKNIFNVAFAVLITIFGIISGIYTIKKMIGN